MTETQTWHLDRAQIAKHSTPGHRCYTKHSQEVGQHLCQRTVHSCGRGTHSARFGATPPLASAIMNFHMPVMGLRISSSCGAMNTSMGMPAAAIVPSHRVFTFCAFLPSRAPLMPPWFVKMTTRCPESWAACAHRIGLDAQHAPQRPLRTVFQTLRMSTHPRCVHGTGRHAQHRISGADKQLRLLENCKTESGVHRTVSAATITVDDLPTQTAIQSAPPGTAQATYRRLQRTFSTAATSPLPQNFQSSAWMGNWEPLLVSVMVPSRSKAAMRSFGAAPLHL